MRILQVHNKYQQYGGEDVIVKSEYDLLIRHNHVVKQLFFDNKDIAGSIVKKIHTAIGITYNYSSEKRILEEMENFRPDVVHVHNFFPLVSPSVFYAASKKNIPVIATINNYRLICANAQLFREGRICEVCIHKMFPLSGIFYSCYRNSVMQSFVVTWMAFYHKWKKTWISKVDKYIIAMTNFGKDKLANSSLVLPPDKVVVKPNFVDDAGYGGTIRNDWFLFFGRLSEEKGIRVLLEAVEKAKFNLKIIGTGPLRGLVEQKALSNSSIEYLGFREKPFIVDMIKKSRAVIFPSLWYEGMPLSVLETLSTGTPLIISDLPSFNEIITHSYNGVIFETGNASALVNAIHYFNEKRTDSFYKNARETYLQKYTPERNYELLISVYQSVIDAKKKGNKYIH